MTSFNKEVDLTDIETQTGKIPDIVNFSDYSISKGYSTGAMNGQTGWHTLKSITGQGFVCAFFNYAAYAGGSLNYQIKVDGEVAWYKKSPDGANESFHSGLIPFKSSCEIRGYTETSSGRFDYGYVILYK